VWSDFVQNRLVPAQYYRDTTDYENYLAHSNFLADINNERKEKNALYAKNLAELENFVMVVFKSDQTVIPKESGWFSEVQLLKDGDKEVRRVIPLQNRKMYKDDWIGLKALDDKGALVFEEVEGKHMSLNDTDLERLFNKYFGPEGKTFNHDDGWKGEL
jgi:palmitoyl-protein thioesterase